MARIGLDVLPRPVSDDLADGWLTDTKPRSQCFLMPTSNAKCAHCYDIALAQLGIVMFGTWTGRGIENAIAMYLVLTMRYIFQILKAIVFLVAVLMVYLLTARQRPDEGGKHKTMNLKLFARTFPKQGDSLVSHGAKFPLRFNPCFSPIAPWGYSPDCANVADFVNTVIVGYRSPFHVWRVA